MKKSLSFILFLFVTALGLSQTTVTLQDQCNCEVLSGTDVSTPGALTPTGADIGDIYVNTTSGTIFYWDGDSWELTATDNQQLTGFSFNDTTNLLTLDLENGGSINVDLSSLSDTLSDTNTTITSFDIDAGTNSLVITDSDTNTFSVAMADIAALVDTDDQTLSEVLTEGADAGGTVITNVGTPVAAGDAVTKAYVDGLADDDISAVTFDGTDLSVTESGTTLSADISSLDDSAGVTANAGNIATNTTNIATNAGDITTNAGNITTNTGNITTNATDIANHIAADDDTDDTNELQDLSEVLTEGADAGGTVITNVGTPVAAGDAVTKAYVDGLADDDISAVTFDGTDLSVTESGTTLSADISSLDDSAGVTANAGNIATNTTNIATNAGDITTNAGNITTNTGNITTNATDIANHIAADDDTDDTNELQDLSEVLTEGADAGGTVITNVGTPVAAGDAVTKAYVDGLADDDISAVTFDGTDLSVTESGTTLSADISSLDDSAGVTANAGNIATNTTNIATNAGDITTNAGNITTNTGNITTNATDIANHIAADDDTDDTNEYNTGSGITAGSVQITDGGGTESVNLISTDANNDIAAGTDGALYLNVASVTISETNTVLGFNSGTNELTYANELGNNPAVDISSLDDSAGVTANAGNIATNTTNIATNAGDITTNAGNITTNTGNITTNATDIANHIAADDDTDDTNELQDLSEVLTEGADAGGTVITNVGTPVAAGDAVTKAYVDGLADDDISAVTFDGTDLSVTESGTTLSADISSLDDSAGVTANAGNIATNTTNIATNAGDITTNAGNITTNTGNITTNATDIANHIAADDDTDDTNELQDLSEVLTEGADAGGTVITNVGTPVAAGDAVTKAYVDGLADDDISAVTFDGTDLSVTESGTTLSADISSLDDSAGVTANAGNIATNTTNIATNAGDITTNAGNITTNTGNITTNATDIANHIAADDDTDDTNEYNTGSGITAGSVQITDGGGTESVNLISTDANNDIAAGTDGALYLNVASVTISETNTVLGFNSGTNELTYANELGNNPAVDISSLDDSAGVTANAGNIATNTTNIATNAGDITTNAGNITTNTGNITTNATDIANHIAADDDTDDTNELQDLSEVLTEGADAGGTVITNVGTPVAAGDAVTKAYVDGLADDDISAVTFDGTDLSVTESGTTLSADISSLDDSAGVTANAGNIATNTTNIATNAGDITTNAGNITTNTGNITTNATDIANHIAADDDTDDTNELQDLSEVLTEGADAGGTVITNVGTPVAAGDAVTKAYVDGLADDDISAVTFDGTDLSVTESGTTLSADISSLDDSAGVTANAGNIATNTTNIATNAGDITTNAGNITTNTGNITTNATDIANHIAADDDTDDTNEYNTGSGITAGSVQITDGGGTESVNLISTDANNDIAAGTDGALYLNVASVTISETNTVLGFNSGTNELTYANELGNNPAVDISSLDDSAGVTANAGNIATNTTNIATNAGDITTNAGNITTNTGNITTNATDIANHIAADDDTDDTNEYNTGSGITAGSVQITDGGGTESVNLISTDANNDIAAGTDGALYLNVASVTISETNTVLGFNSGTNELTYANELGNNPAVDISSLDDSAGVTANAGNIATNTTNIATNAGDITTNAGNITTNTGNITTNATDIANHIAADDDTDDTNELQDLSEVLTEGADAGGTVITNVGTPVAAGDAVTKAYVDGLADDDISAVTFDGTDLSVTESGTTLSADISSLDDSAGVTANAGNIATNTTNIATNAGDITTNAGNITTNTGNITTNATDIANHIAADDDTDDTNELQDLSEVLTEGADAGGTVITNVGTPVAAGDAVTKAYVDGLADDDISAVTFDGTDLSVTESGTTLSADISSLDDSAGVTANAGNIATNTTNIATNAGDITTNAGNITTNTGNITTNATDIANHIAADDDTDDTNELQDLSEVLTEGADAGGTVITNVGTPVAAGDAVTKAYVDGLADDDISAVTFDGTDLSVTESGTTLSADISSLDDSAGVTANAGNIATNTTNIATNAGDITTNAGNITTNTGNITTNATDIANHIAADDDTDDTNEYNTGSGITAGSVQITDGGGTESVNLISTDANNDIAAGTDGALYLNVASVTISETNTVLGFNSGTNELTYANELGNNPAVDISSLDDSAGVTANAGNIATNTTNIATNAGDITTNAGNITTNTGNITTNATDIANHIAADDDTDDTNELQDLSEVLTEGADAGGTVITNVGTPVAAGDAVTKAYVDGLADDDISAVTFDGTDLSVTESGTTLSADISSLDDSAGVTANAGNIATNTTNIATNAGDITTNAGNITTNTGNITTNATDIANHIAADDDTDDTNELNTRFEVNGANLELEDADGTLQVALSDLGTDDQDADEVVLATDVDLDENGTDETTVQEALSALDAMPKIYATGKVGGNGTAASIYGATVSRLNEGDYQVTFSTALANANYIIQVATLDCGGDCPGNTGSNYDDPGISYYNQATTGFRVNIGDSDNGTTQKDDIDLEFMFTVIVIP